MQSVKLVNQLSIGWRFIVTIGIGCVMLSLLSSCSANKRGAATPEKVVEQYLIGLENKNERLLLQLLEENSTQSITIAAKINKIGGYKIQNKRDEYNKFTPNLWKAKITGNYVDRQGLIKKLEDAISIQYQINGQPKSYAGRWYLKLE